MVAFFGTPTARPGSGKGAIFIFDWNSSKRTPVFYYSETPISVVFNSRPGS